MVDNEPLRESFEAFKNSFSYGSRTDMNFKFLSKLSDEEASTFLRRLLSKIGDSIDDGNYERIRDHVFDWQIKGYRRQEKFDYDNGPFCRPEKPVSRSRLALMTSSGHFVEGEDPEPFGVQNMTQEEAMSRVLDFLKETPSLSRIPIHTPREKLRVRHCGYDIRGAQADPNVVFPVERLAELEKEKIIGELASDAYSFVGACAQKRLLKQTGPLWVRTFMERAIDIALLVPV
jgi:hypothetical protein